MQRRLAHWFEIAWRSIIVKVLILAWIACVLAVYFAQNAPYAVRHNWNIAIDEIFTAAVSIRY